jgi:hypothetical protein
MFRLARPICVVASAIILSSCASGQQGPVRGGGGDDRALKGIPNLFISPAGEPFRAPRGQPYPIASWFDAADANHDGRLTREEFRADAARFFKALDTNHDGQIDGFEVQNYEQVIAPEINPEIGGLRFGEGMDLSLGRDQSSPDIGRSPSGSHREEAGDRRPEGAGIFGLLDEPEPVAATDTDFNGHITLQEFLAAADRRFDVLDKKKLGYLTLETVPKTPAQTAIQRREARRAKDAKPK